MLESVATHEASSGDQIPRFWLWEAMKHVSVVGFIKRRPDLHISERERHILLRLMILDTVARQR